MSAGVINKINKKIDELGEDCLRGDVLVSLRTFRASWVELGKLLTDVAYGGDYKDWGYDDFEIYCASELGLKKPTVKKLMVSYNYMKSFEPEQLRDGNVAIDFETIEQLKKMRECDNISEEEKDEFHRMAFGGEAEPAALRKEIKERMKPDLNDIDKANEQRQKEIEGIKRSVKSMRAKLAGAKSVPESVKVRTEEALCELEALN